MNAFIFTVILFASMQAYATYPQTYPQDVDIVTQIDDCLYGMELCMAGAVITGFML